MLFLNALSKNALLLAYACLLGKKKHFIYKLRSDNFVYMPL